MKKHKLSKKLLSLSLACALTISSVPVVAFAADDSNDTITALSVNGEATEYTALFPVINNYSSDYWKDIALKYNNAMDMDGDGDLDGDDAVAAYSYVQNMMTASLYGTDAIEAYTSNPATAAFKCDFINADTITFDGYNITIKNGPNSETHTYKYVKQLAMKMSLNGMEYSMDGALYKTDDTNAGEYTYFLLMPDSPGETYHIEFRYGATEEVLEQGTSGDLAYWLAAGIPTNATNQLKEDCIDLLLSENIHQESDYVMMNIPYADFYTGISSNADAVSSATTGKALNTGLAGNSYHTDNAPNEDGYVTSSTSDAIQGITYAVKVDESAKEWLAQQNQIWGNASTTYQINNRGRVQTSTVSGQDALFGAGNYAYYTLPTEPTAYVELSLVDGKPTFSTIKSADNALEIPEKTGVTTELTVNGRHTYYEIVLSGLENDISSKVSAVTVTTDENKTFGLGHVAQIWRGTELGFGKNISGLSGNTIKTITYYLTDGSAFNIPVDIEIPEALDATVSNMLSTDKELNVTIGQEDAENVKATVSYRIGSGREAQTVTLLENAAVNNGKIDLQNVTLPAAGTNLNVSLTSDNYTVANATVGISDYVMLNIPYTDFYTGIGSNADVVSSATTGKALNRALSGNSYHTDTAANAEGYVTSSTSDAIQGITYAVKVDESSQEWLTAQKRILDNASTTYQINNRGNLQTSTVSGQDALYGAGNYAYYVLAKEPSAYVDLTVANNIPSFSAIKSAGNVVEATNKDGVTTDLTVNGRHTYYEIVLKGLDSDISSKVSAVTVTTDENNTYGLGHVAQIWRGTELGFNKNTDGLAGQTIKTITYYFTTGEIFNIDVDIAIPEALEITASSMASNARSIDMTIAQNDVANPKATVSYRIGSGREAQTVTLLEDAQVIDGRISLNGMRLPESGTSLTVTVTSDNYAPATTTVTVPRSSSTGGGGGATVVRYGISIDDAIDNGRVATSSSSAASGTTVTITTTPDNGFTTDTVSVTDANGNSVAVDKINNNSYSFTMPSEKVSVSASFKENADNGDTSLFTDVHSSDYFFNAVEWAVNNNITSGTSASTFSPNGNATRAQSVTFLWRLAGSPSSNATNPFTDVSTSDYYYDAVLWAVENGITVGTTDTTFSPNDNCTRAQIATFLWRAANSETVSTSNPFSDVSADDYFYDAVLWAVDRGITVGTTDSTFSPNDNCTRGQIVTFLFRENVR